MSHELYFIHTMVEKRLCKIVMYGKLLRQLAFFARFKAAAVQIMLGRQYA